MSNQSEFAYVYPAGKHRGIEFQIGVRADPSINEHDSFAAILFFQLRDGTRVEVAKVDNAEQEEGTIHIDRYYREVGADIKDFSSELPHPTRSPLTRFAP
jgi:hypothetical protein